MTENQSRFFYFPAWGRCAAAHGWRMEKGRFAGRHEASFGHSAEVNGVYQAVWETAALKARGEHRVMTADDLRHACHAVAVGRDKSSRDLSNVELDRVVALFKLLANPGDLDAVLDYFHPENQQRQRMEWWLEHCCVPGYVAKECARIYGTSDWHSLSYESLKGLHDHLRARPHALVRTRADGSGRVDAAAHRAAVQEKAEQRQPLTTGNGIL